MLAEALASMDHIATVLPVETNIVIFTLRDADRLAPFIAYLQDHGILAHAFGPGMVRMVTHLDLSDGDITHAITIIKEHSE